MKILFLTIARIKGLAERNIYTDLMRKFCREGHEVYIACPAERRYHESTSCNLIDGVTVLNIWTLNAQKCSLLEKGLCILLLDKQFKKAIAQYFSDIKFDLVLYSTPPITFTNTITYIKKRDNAVSYLLLKDIFPQNAADLGMIGQKGPVYRYFREKEKRMYAVSNFIGCLSPANIAYLLKHNPGLDPAIIEVNSNSVEPIEKNISQESKKKIREKYHIPATAIVFLYGGNLGKPQGIDFLLQVLEASNGAENTFFIVVGSGTEFPPLQQWYQKVKPGNILLMESIPKHEFDNLVMACDIGLIFLDKRFTIPNFPSRLLSYLENEMPVLAATDVNTDVGKIIEEAQCGFWVESGNLEKFNERVKSFVNDPNSIEKMGKNGKALLLEKYTVDISYSTIMNRMKNV